MKAFVIDVSKCSGCYSCQIVCKDEHVANDWSPYAKPQPDTGQFWMHIRENIRGSIPKIKVAYVPVMCQHCADAPCAAACPPKAINTRQDGLVLIDPAKCTGCQNCLDACPYGVIFYNEDLHLAQKCTGCAHLLDRKDGSWKVPRCVDACSYDAIQFGEEADLKALSDKGEVLATNFGAAPKVRAKYIGLPKRFIGGTVYDPGTEEVLIGATVTLSGDGTGSVKTDDFGDFNFEGLKVGNFTVKIEAGGKSKTIDKISTAQDVNLGDIALS